MPGQMSELHAPSNQIPIESLVLRIERAKRKYVPSIRKEHIIPIITSYHEPQFIAHQPVGLTTSIFQEFITPQIIVQFDADALGSFRKRKRKCFKRSGFRFGCGTLFGAGASLEEGGPSFEDPSTPAPTYGGDSYHRQTLDSRCGAA